MSDKILKPKDCFSCPAVKIEKNILICMCDKKLKASLMDKKEQQTMYNKCVLLWDKE